MKASQAEILVTAPAFRRFPADLQALLTAYPADVQGGRLVPRGIYERVAADRLARLPAPCRGCDYRGRVHGDHLHCRAAGSCDVEANRIGFAHACPLGRWDARERQMIDGR